MLTGNLPVVKLNGSQSKDRGSTIELIESEWNPNHDKITCPSIKKRLGPPNEHWRAELWKSIVKMVVIICSYRCLLET